MLRPQSTQQPELAPQLRLLRARRWALKAPPQCSGTAALAAASATAWLSLLMQRRAWAAGCWRAAASVATSWTVCWSGMARRQRCTAAASRATASMVGPPGLLGVSLLLNPAGTFLGGHVCTDHCLRFYSSRRLFATGGALSGPLAPLLRLQAWRCAAREAGSRTTGCRATRGALSSWTTTLRCCMMQWRSSTIWRAAPRAARSMWWQREACGGRGEGEDRRFGPARFSAGVLASFRINCIDPPPTPHPPTHNHTLCLE